MSQVARVALDGKIRVEDMELDIYIPAEVRDVREVMRELSGRVLKFILSVRI